ncbi:Lrp/AsnC family transcriptional regulator [Alteromonas gracilis]
MSTTQSPQPPDPESGARLDDVSKRIIEVLQEDGRASYAAIAKVVGLSEGAVRVRVQRLLDAGVMQIVAVTDPVQVGFTRQAMIGIRTEGAIGEVADRLSEMPEVDYVVTTAGSFDLLVEVVCENDHHLLDLLSNGIRTIDGVVATETFVYLKLNKQHYNWGTR